MGVATSILYVMNRFFKLPEHPFNRRNRTGESYARWQYERGEDTVRFYLAHAGSAEAMFRGKDVLDVGCGAAGKSVYYAGLGARRVVGLEILEKYREEAESLAREKGAEGVFSFLCADAKDTGLAGGAFDTIVMNDAMEHVADPEGVLRECLRLLRPGGRLYVNFPPYHHPYGAHLSDAIGIPWVHLLFGEKTLVEAYKALVRGLPDGEERIAFRISRRGDGEEYFSYINRMTIRRFRAILRGMGVEPAYYREVPLRRAFAPLAKLPLAKEMFVRMVVAVLEKPVAALEKPVATL